MVRIPIGKLHHSRLPTRKEKMDIGKYLQPGSPLVTPAKPETFRLILTGIFDGREFPQDAIATAMFDEAAVGLPAVMKETIKKFRIREQDFKHIWKGYLFALTAINVAVKAR